MGKRHAPSLMRQIRRELKEGTSPEFIFPKVKAIEDPYYRSLSFYLLIPYFSPKDKKCKESMSLSNKDIEKVRNKTIIELMKESIKYGRKELINK